MSFSCLSLVLALTSLVTIIKCETVNRPNIVLIVADDLGWNDVSYHGSNQVLTPNIDLLAYTGIPLTRYYTHSICTPSRAALLTGKFAHRVGMHGYVLTNAEDRGLPANEKILSQYLKDLAYSTHLVGKWHVGRTRTEYLPTSRGFDSYFGHLGSHVDYYEYTSEETWNIGPVSGFDLFRNSTPVWDVEGYITDVYTNEAKRIIETHNKCNPLFLMISHNAPHAANEGALLQAPPEDVRKARHVESPERRIFAAMVKKLDDSIGEIMGTLSDKQMLDNTIVIFISDNGGMISGLSHNFGSNWPLRGTKFSPFEGGIRVCGMLWSPKITKSYEWNGYMHVVDWLPTILGALNTEIPTDIDGINLWNRITANAESKRNDFFEIYQDNTMNYEVIVSNDYKLVTRNVNPQSSRYQGDNFNGIIDPAPLYQDSILNSKMYEILKDVGKQFALKDLDVRHKFEIRCGQDRNTTEAYDCNNGTLCLFNIKEDPCETKDVSKEFPEVVSGMLLKLKEELKRVIARPSVYRDPRGLPRFFNYTWGNSWADNLSS